VHLYRGSETNWLGSDRQASLSTVAEPFTADAPLPNAFLHAAASASSRAETGVAAISVQQSFASSATFEMVPRITVLAGNGTLPDCQGVWTNSPRWAGAGAIKSAMPRKVPHHSFCMTRSRRHQAKRPQQDPAIRHPSWRPS
jgi:hypothetical protein